MVTATNAVTATEITEYVRPAVEQAIEKLLLSIGCKNCFASPLPPITTWTEWEKYLRVHEGLEQSENEGWFAELTGFSQDALTRGTWSQYQQEHSVRILGAAWHQTFHRSYRYIHNQAERLVWTIEKNKGFLTDRVDEVRDIRVRFDFNNLGSVYMYRATIDFNLLISKVETAGRV